MMQKDESKSYVEAYLKSLMITKNIRYSASSRLRIKNNLSLFTVSILSIYVIIASIAPLFFNDLDSKTTSILYLFSIICSLFIIALSLLESNKDYKTRSELLLKCARRITLLIDRIKYLISTDCLNKQEFEKIQDEYNKLLSEFTVNHDEIDYVYYLAKNTIINKEDKAGVRFKMRCSKSAKQMKCHLNTYIYHFILIIAPLGILLII